MGLYVSEVKSAHQMVPMGCDTRWREKAPETKKEAAGKFPDGLWSP
jgi:hypothetical protein